MLVFGKANAKLKALETAMGRKVATFSLLSGSTCPYAKDCKSTAMVNPNSGKRYIQDGPDTLFRCFSASQEAQYTGVYNSRNKNGDEILMLSARSIDAAANVIELSLPKKVGIVRIHVGGDFKTQAYFDAWVEVANRKPDVIFYAYTKSLPFWVKRLGALPANLVLTASYGGYKDSLIEKHGLRFCKVVFSEAEAAGLGLEIDHDDSHAAMPSKSQESFALLLHGTQPPKTAASAALKALNGKGSYSTKKGKR